MTTLLLLAPALVPLVGALIYALIGWRRATRWVAGACAVGLLTVAVVIAVRVTGPDAVAGLLTGAGLLRADALSAYLLIVIGCVAVIATVATPAYLGAELSAGRMDGQECAWYSVLVQVFLAVMALAVLAANLGVFWVAIEATTVVTAFLVGQRRTRAAVEAAWKYVVISSTGIALALLGTFLLNYADQHTPDPAGLDWTGLATVAPDLDPGVTRIAVALLVIGFGTKAGLAPLHAWLPDVYSQAPAPVAAMMSGVLSSVAFYAVLRVKVIADAALGADFTRALLLVMALASLAVAASLMLAQRDYKRMLGYSSIENMGLLALGAAIGGPVAIAAVLLHILGHGLVKSALFVGAGRLLRLTGSTRMRLTRGVAVRAPVLAGCFGLGVLALLGFPPFSLFASEFGIARAGFAGGLGWATAAALLLVLVIAGSVLVHTSRMLLGRDPDDRAGGADEPATPTADGVAEPATPAAKGVTEFATPTAHGVAELAPLAVRDVVEFATPTAHGVAEFATPTAHGVAELAPLAVRDVVEFATPTAHDVAEFATPTAHGVAELAPPATDGVVVAARFAVEPAEPPTAPAVGVAAIPAVPAVVRHSRPEVPETSAPAPAAGHSTVAVLVAEPLAPADGVRREASREASTAAVPAADENPVGAGHRRRAGADLWAMAGALAVCAVLGLWLGPLGPLLQQAAAVVTGGAP